MFEPTPIVEAKRARDYHVGAFGPLLVSARPADKMDMLFRSLFERAAERVAKALKDRKIPPKLVKGRIILVMDESPVEGSIGSHDAGNDTPVIYTVSDGEIMSYSKLTWTMMHELGHRVWGRMSEGKRARFEFVVDKFRRPLEDKIVKLMIKQQKNSKQVLPDLYYRLYDSLLWTFKVHGGKEGEFPDFLRQHKVTAELPTEYANTTVNEAWAESFATIVLRRRKTKTHRLVGPALKKTIEDIIMDLHESLQAPTELL